MTAVGGDLKLLCHRAFDRTLLLILLIVSLASATRAQATNVTSMICGSDPAILTALHPIRAGASGPELQSQPDVTFTFEGTRPCAPNACRIVMRHGTSGRVMAAIRLPSDSITYCRERNPFSKWPSLHPEQGPEGCRGGFYANTRVIVFGKDVDDIDISGVPGVWMAWFQNKRAGGKPTSECTRTLYGDAKVPKGFIRFRTENQGLLDVFEASNSDNLDKRHRHLMVPR